MRDLAEQDPSPGRYFVPVRPTSAGAPANLRLAFRPFVSLEPEGNILVGNPEEQQQVVQRSRLQAVLREAGGISAAVSEESMRRLRYCLQWLQVSSTRLDSVAPISISR
jgi:Transcription factor Opi1